MSNTIKVNHSSESKRKKQEGKAATKFNDSHIENHFFSNNSNKMWKPNHTLSHLISSFFLFWHDNSQQSKKNKIMHETVHTEDNTIWKEYM